jgi:hypothetical protein
MIGVLGFDFRRGLEIFLSTTASGTALGPTHTIQCVPRPLSLGVKWPGREADHSSRLVPRSKNEWIYTSTPQYALMAWCRLVFFLGPLAGVKEDCTPVLYSRSYMCIHVTLKMEASWPSETSVTYLITTWRHNRDDHGLRYK